MKQTNQTTEQINKIELIDIEIKDLGKIQHKRVSEAIQNILWKAKTRKELNSHLDYNTQGYKETESILTEIFTGIKDPKVLLFLNSLVDKYEFLNTKNFKNYTFKKLGDGSFHFDGDDDWIDFGDDAAYDFTNNMSVSFWYYTETTGADMALIVKACIEFYKNTDKTDKRLFGKQEDFKGVFNWYYCTHDGEPDSKVYSLEFNIVEVKEVKK